MFFLLFDFLGLSECYLFDLGIFRFILFLYGSVCMGMFVGWGGWVRVFFLLLGICINVLNLFYYLVYLLKNIVFWISSRIRIFRGGVWECGGVF